MQPRKLTMEYEKNGQTHRVTVSPKDSNPNGTNYWYHWQILDGDGHPKKSGRMVIDAGAPTDVPPIVEVLLTMAF